MGVSGAFDQKAAQRSRPSNSKGSKHEYRYGLCQARAVIKGIWLSSGKSCHQSCLDIYVGDVPRLVFHWADGSLLLPLAIEGRGCRGRALSQIQNGISQICVVDIVFRMTWFVSESFIERLQILGMEGALLLPVPGPICQPRRQTLPKGGPLQPSGL
jgi:hypothetical protein